MTKTVHKKLTAGIQILALGTQIIHLHLAVYAFAHLYHIYTFYHLQIPLELDHLHYMMMQDKETPFHHR